MFTTTGLVFNPLAKTKSGYYKRCPAPGVLQAARLKVFVLYSPLILWMSGRVLFVVAAVVLVGLDAKCRFSFRCVQSQLLINATWGLRYCFVPSAAELPKAVTLVTRFASLRMRKPCIRAMVRLGLVYWCTNSHWQRVFNRLAKIPAEPLQCCRRKSVNFSFLYLLFPKCCWKWCVSVSLVQGFARLKTAGLLAL